MFDDVIILLILWRHQNETAEKITDFLSISAEYLKNSSTDFHQTYVTFRQVYLEAFKIKRWKIDQSLLPW